MRKSKSYYGFENLLNGSYDITYLNGKMTFTSPIEMTEYKNGLLYKEEKEDHHDTFFPTLYEISSFINNEIDLLMNGVLNNNNTILKLFQYREAFNIILKLEQIQKLRTILSEPKEDYDTIIKMYLNFVDSILDKINKILSRENYNFFEKENVLSTVPVISDHSVIWELCNLPKYINELDTYIKNLSNPSTKLDEMTIETVGQDICIMPIL